MLGRLLRRVRGQVPFLVALALMVAAVVYLLIWPHHWRRGVGAIAVSMLVAGGLRLGLADHRAGLLGVRNRWADAAFYLVLGAAILAAAIQLG